MNAVLEEIMKNISKEPLENTGIAAKVLANEAGADVCVIIADDSGMFTDIVSFGGQVTVIPGVLERTKAEKQTVVITDELPDGITAIMCVPITAYRNPVAYQDEKRQPTDIHELVKCYAYFQSSRNQHHFTSGFSHDYRGAFNLLGSFVEHYQTLQVASTDKLTGALNRKYTDAALESCFKLAKTEGTCLSIIMTDLDFFKHINDTFGHLTGDGVLREAAQIIRRILRKGDILGRYGGEEFIVMLNGADSAEARVIAERIRIAIQATEILGDERDVTVSLGIATYPEHAITVKELVEKADKALYAAKQTGRNKCETWSSDMDELVVAKGSMQTFFTGDSVIVAARLQALYKIMGLVRQNISVHERINLALSEIQLIIGSSDITMFTTNDAGDETGSYRLTTPGKAPPPYNDAMIRSVVETRQSLCFVDWDSNRANTSDGFADWQSIIVAPAVFLGKLYGVIYAGASVRMKEFTSDEMAFAEYAAFIIAAMIR